MKILCIIMLLSFNSFSQKNVLEVVFKVKFESIGIDLKGTEAQLFQDNELIETTFSDSAGIGRFSNLTPKHRYIIKFRRKGFVTKLAEVNLNSYLFSDPDFFVSGTLQMHVRLFKPLSHENFSFLETSPMIKYHAEPTGIFPLDESSFPSLKNIVHNHSHLREMRWKVNLCRNGLTVHQAENYMRFIRYDPFEVTIEQYKEAVKLGDILFNKGNFIYARSIYKMAFDLTKKKKYLRSQLKKCEKAIKKSSL